MLGFSKKRNTTPKTILKMWEHKSWGNNLQFCKWEHPTGSVVGWLCNKPEAGDELLARFERGVAALRFVNVKPCGDPPDMFFADVEYIGHLDVAGGDETPESYIQKRLSGKAVTNDTPLSTKCAELL